MSFLDDMSKKITDAGRATAQKGKEVADIAKLRSQISEEQKKLREIYEQIGKRYVEELGDTPAESFAEDVDAVRLSQDKIEECQKKIGEIKGVVKCPKCGEEAPSGSAFCSACGAKMPEPEPEVVDVEEYEEYEL